MNEQLSVGNNVWHLKVLKDLPSEKLQSEVVKGTRVYKMILVQCSCGKVFKAKRKNVIYGFIKSCGYCGIHKKVNKAEIHQLKKCSDSWVYKNMSESEFAKKMRDMNINTRKLLYND